MLYHDVIRRVLLLGGRNLHVVVHGAVEYRSVCGLEVGIAIDGMLEDLRGRPDLRLGRLQDRVVAWSWPERERLAEVAVAGILRRDQQVQPVCEPVGEGAVRGGQVLDPLAY